MEIISGERNQDLTSAAKLAETRKDEADRLLYPQIGIKPQPIVAVPDIADRHTETQLPPPRFGASRVKHARSQNAELKLADTALHAQQQSIVGPTRIVHPVEIYDARFNQAAQFQEMVPIPAIAGKARCVEAEHCANFARAQAAHQSFETRAIYSTAGDQGHRRSHRHHGNPSVARHRQVHMSPLALRLFWT
ncbi:hypothetical protein X737_39135 [Mesorhizobium sp. L48C026A00]|nr:hypothetical protein X737_39135 [Mesorhizobium sp. L48C026A00]